MVLPLETTCAKVKSLLDADEPVQLVDCREPSEHAIAAIDGAQLVPTSMLPAAADQLVPLRDERIIVFCHHGMRSLQFVEWLRSQGFEQAQSMSGGIDRWADEIDPGVARY